MLPVPLRGCVQEDPVFFRSGIERKRNGEKPNHFRGESKLFQLGQAKIGALLLHLEYGSGHFQIVSRLNGFDPNYDLFEIPFIVFFEK